MTHRLYVFIFILWVSVQIFAQSSLPSYKNPGLSVDLRVADLLSRMTLEERRSVNYFVLWGGRCTK